MFITKEQMEARLNSPKNILNVIQKSSPSTLTPDQAHTPDFGTSLIPALSTDKLVEQNNGDKNLPYESNKQRAARLARFNIDYGCKKGEYIVNPNISNDIVRSTIGVLAASKQCSSQEIQKEFGVTKNQIIGAVNSKKLNIKDKIALGKDRVSELALDKLMETLGLLSIAEIAGEKPKDRAMIAEKMSNIFAQMSKTEEKEDKTKVSLTVISPGIRDISAFTTIDV